jgi:hypothetical protein
MNDLQNFHQKPFHQWAENQQHLSCERLLGMLGPVIHQLRTLHKEGKAHGSITPDSLLVSQETQQIDLSRFTACAADRIARGTAYSPPEADQDAPVPPCVRADLYSLAATCASCDKVDAQ